MTLPKDTEIKKVVREGYAAVARGARSCCGSTCSCGGDDLAQTPRITDKPVGNIWSNPVKKLQSFFLCLKS